MSKNQNNPNGRSKGPARVVSLLESGREYSTNEIISQAKVCAVASLVSELRRTGLPIVCTRKGKNWFYKIEARSAASRRQAVAR